MEAGGGAGDSEVLGSFGHLNGDSCVTKGFMFTTTVQENPPLTGALHIVSRLSMPLWAMACWLEG